MAGIQRRFFSALSRQSCLSAVWGHSCLNMQEYKFSKMSGGYENTLSPADYVIFGGMLLISLLIGIFYAYRNRKSYQGTEGYLMAGRSMGVIPTGISLTVSFQSTITVLGMPSDVYHYGITILWSILSRALTFLAVAFIFVPTLYNLKISSAYEYLDKRFGRPMRLISTSLYLMSVLLYMGTNIYGPAIALSGVTGFDLVPAMLSTGLVCMVYTALGGLRGVIWTDVFQSIIMFVGMLSIIIRGSMLLGGFDKVSQIAIAGKRFNPDPRIRYTWWTMMVGLFVMWTGTFGTNQIQVQRIVSVKSQKKAIMALGLGLFGMCVYTALAALCGIVIYGVYHRCDPKANGCLRRRDEIVPLAVVNIFQDLPGMIGLFLACVYSASLSTVSSGINSMVTVVVQDFIKPYTKWSDKVYVWVAKGLTVLCGSLAIGISFLASVYGDIVSFGIASASGFTGPSLGVFLIGIWLPFGNSWGAIAGLISGFVACFVKFFGGLGLKKPDYLLSSFEFGSDHCPANCDYSLSPNINYTSIVRPTRPPNTDELQGIENFYALSVFYMASVGLATSLFVGIIVSLISGGWKERHKVDPRLMRPPFESRLFSWIPSHIRSTLRCGVDWKDYNDSDSISEEYKGEDNPAKEIEEDGI